MDKIFYLIFVTLFLLFSCNGRQQTADSSTVKEIKKTSSAYPDSSDVASAKVTVYYFHGDRKCITCKTVGEISKQLVDDRFKENAQVCFQDVNIDNEENEQLAERYQITGSALCVSNGKQTENLTAFAFGNARTAPDKLKEKLIEVINTQLN